MLPQRYSSRPLLLRPYFIILLSIPALLVSKHHRVLPAALLAMASAVLYLSMFWSVKIAILQDFSKDPNGLYILFENNIVRLHKEQPPEGTAGTCYSFQSQHRKYLLLSGKIEPVVPRLDFSFKELTNGVKHERQQYFPSNDLRVPNPSFLRLFKEQCVTPLFCFQVFSSLLMCFDSHILQGLFSTLTIIIVELTLVGSRAVTLKMFRSLESKETSVKLLSQDAFNKFLRTREVQEGVVKSSKDLQPGHIVELSTPTHVPCDLVLLSGSCAVNEAMLSGESTPLIKEPIQPSPTIFDISHHKKHILYGHSTIEKIDGPVIARVLRTGFETEQGSLLSKMISAEDMKYDPEALKFILILTSLALINSLFTFKYSKKTGYPLFIDVIVLFTSSIPFELPMEMSVVVHGIVKKLAAKNIFCLEPFRISLAGKVSVCCFDKTGTLTETKIELKEVKQSTDDTVKILLCCNGLMTIQDKIRGDPLDIAILDYLNNKVSTKAPERNNLSFTQLKQFPFTSELMRHGTIAVFGTETIFATKGAPEVIKGFLKEVPKDFDEYKSYAADGYRVIAMAHKELAPLEAKAPFGPQEEYEHSLHFAGFLLFGATLKRDAAVTCKTLAESGHKIVMITGDNILTARCVAKQLGMSTKGVEGADIDGILKTEEFFKIGIFARADPKHKEMILKRYKSAGMATMMVGDGTNDVGALKAADVGIAMLESAMALPDLKHKKASTGLQRSAALQQEQLVTIKPGDASAAAPFTVRSDSLSAITAIIQHGRSSLVTTIQMYKILALNSVTNAFFLTFTDILGVKFSESQMFSLGILSALAFSAISASKPMSFVSKQRPVTTIFSPYMLLSIFGQAVVHIVTNALIFRYIPAPAISTKFEPSIMNTVLYLLSCSQTISTFACNYIGRPFRESFHENKIMIMSMLGLSCFCLNIIFRLHEDLNNMLEMVAIGEYSVFVVCLVLFDSVASFMIEKILFRVFMIS